MKAMDRNMLMEAMTAVAVCFGIWMVVIQPMVNEVGDLEQRITDAGEADDHASLERLADQLQHVSTRVIEIKKNNEFALDTSGIYTALRRLGLKHEVKIANIDLGQQPKESNQSKGPQPVSFSIVAAGSFNAVAAFLGDVDHINGFIRVTAVDLRKEEDEGRNLITSRIQLDALRFAIPVELDGGKDKRDVDE